MSRLASLLRILAVAVLLTQLVGSFDAVPSVSAADDVADELIVTLTDSGQAHAPDVHRKAGGKVARQLGKRPVHVVKVDIGRAATVKATYLADSRVKSVEQNARVRKTALPNDPGYAQQWGLATMRAPEAWTTTKGSAAVLVGVIDTGIDQTHPDLKGQIVAAQNFSSAVTVQDVEGHGTHVAGTIAAVTNNNVGVSGTAPGVKLLIGRALDDDGVGTYAQVIEAMDWAVDSGAKVVNLSLAGSAPSPALADAVQYAHDHGALVVAAAGNFGTTQPTYPAAYPGVVGVAATDQADGVASFSNRGTWVQLGAPGVGVYSTLPGGQYGVLSGSSMASGYVAGTAALAASVAGLAQSDDLRAVLTDSAAKVPGTGSSFAAGRVDAAAAVALAAHRASTYKAPAGNPGQWQVRGGGRVGTRTGPQLLINAQIAKTGGYSGYVAFTDNPAHVHFVSDKIEAISVVDGLATVTGTGHLVGGKSGLKFGVRLDFATPGRPADHATFSYTGAGAPFLAESALASSTLMVVGARVNGTATPTRTPVGGDGGGTVVAAATCSTSWQTITVSPSPAFPSTTGVTYTISTITPNKSACALTSASSTISVKFPAGTDVSNYTGGTMNSTAIQSVTITGTSGTGQTMTFAPPTNLGSNTAVNLVLNGITNPTAATYSLTMSAANPTGGGSIPSTTSSSYTIAAATSTPTSTNTPTSTRTPTSTNTPTITNTPTVTRTNTPGPSPTFTNTPTITPTPTSTYTPTITPTFTQTPTVTPSFTATVVPGQCATAWQTLTVSPSSILTSTSSNYTITAKTANSSGCDLTTTTQLTVDLPADSDVTSVTGTLSGSAITFISRIGSVATFYAPVAVGRNTSFTIVLNGVINPSTAQVYSLDLSASNTGDGGIVPITPSSTYTIAVATATPTATPTATATNSPTGTPPPTSTSTNTPTSTRTPTATPTFTITPTVTLTRTNTPGPSPTPTNTATLTATPTICAYTACDYFQRSNSTTQMGLTAAYYPSGTLTPTPLSYNRSGYAERGGAWQTDGSVWGVSSNQAYVVSSSWTENYARVDNYTILADHTSTLYVAAGYFDGSVALIDRVSSDWSTNMVWVGMDASGNVTVWTLANGTWTQVASGSNTPAIGYTVARTLSATYAGTALTVKINGSTVSLSPSFTVTNTSGASGVYIDTSGTTPPKINYFTVS